MVRQLCRALVLGSVCLMLTGCPASSGRPEAAKFPVTGTVTLDGQLLPTGTIYFKTIATGAIDTAEIKDGKFDGKAQEGDRRVEICAYETIPATGNGPMDKPRQRNTIPAKYNQESNLTAKVEKGGQNQFSFELTSK